MRPNKSHAMKLKALLKMNGTDKLMEYLREVWDDGERAGRGIDTENCEYLCGQCGKVIDDCMDARYCKWCGCELDFRYVEDQKDV